MLDTKRDKNPPKKHVNIPAIGAPVHLCADNNAPKKGLHYSFRLNVYIIPLEARFFEANAPGGKKP